MRGDDRELWSIASGDELIKLIVDTKTLVPIYRHDQPLDQRRFTTYYNPQVKEKLDAQGEIVRRVRGTFGGNKTCAYSGPTSSPVADISLIKIHWNSVISDRRNLGTDTRYGTLDLKDFYLKSTLPQPEWITIPVKDIPTSLLAKHDLKKFVVDGHILCRVDGTMYGHPLLAAEQTLHLSHTYLNTILYKIQIYPVFSRTAHAVFHLHLLSTTLGLNIIILLTLTFLLIV